MSRYIDADALLDIFKVLKWYASYSIVNGMPTADVVEVVRCKDCVFDNGILKYCCHVYQEKMDCPTDFVQSDDDFCSWGVRKERR